MGPALDALIFATATAMFLLGSGTPAAEVLTAALAAIGLSAVIFCFGAVRGASARADKFRAGMVAALDRAASACPKRPPPPADAVCYVCFDGDGCDGGLVRDCVCRGTSGWAHLKCIQEATDVMGGKYLCGVCRVPYRGRLLIGLARRKWAADGEKELSDLARREAAGLAAYALLMFGETREALRIQRELYDYVAPLDDSDPNEVFRTAIQLATAYDESGQIRMAEFHLRHLAGWAATAFGPDDDYALRSRERHGAVLNRLGRDTEAAEVVETALALARERGCPDNDPFVAGILTSLAHIKESLKENAEAVALYRKLAASSTDSFGPRHPHVLLLKTNMAAALAKTAGGRAEAEALFEATIAGLEEECGPAHPDTAYARTKVAWCEEHAWDPDALVANVQLVYPADGEPGTVSS